MVDVDAVEEARQILATHPIFELRNITVSLGIRGGIEITGTVGSFYAKQLAQEAIRKCSQNTQIINRVEVS